MRNRKLLRPQEKRAKVCPVLWVHYNHCFSGQQSWYDVPPFMVSFSVDNPSVSQIDSFGLMTALAPGLTNIRASWNTVGIIHKDANGECWIESATAEPTAFCEVQTPDFTVAHDKQQTGIRPSGIIAGVNGADPPIPVSDTQATITVSTNPECVNNFETPR